MNAAKTTARTPAERKQLERARRREKGLILKQVWVSSQNWPAMQKAILALGGQTHDLGGEK